MSAQCLVCESGHAAPACGDHRYSHRGLNRPRSPLLFDGDDLHCVLRHPVRGDGRPKPHRPPGIGGCGGVHDGGRGRLQNKPLVVVAVLAGRGPFDNVHHLFLERAHLTGSVSARQSHEADLWSLTDFANFRLVRLVGAGHSSSMQRQRRLVPNLLERKTGADLLYLRNR